jgi:hypothetical protein
MTTKDIAMKVMKAWEEKDEVTLRHYLHPDYVSKDPLMTVIGVDKAIDKMHSFPFKGGLEITHLFSEGDLVAMEGIWKITHPIEEEVPITSIMQFEKDVLREKSIYFDTAKISQ